MMHLRAITVYKDDANGVHQVQVGTHLCTYIVTLDKEGATLRGPGVHEEYDLDSLPTINNPELRAIIIVGLFENGEDCLS